MPESNNESWITKNTGPLLAIMTVLMTFFMFGYFVYLANSPSSESADLRKAQHELKRAEVKFSEFSSAKAEAVEPGKREEVKKELEALKKDRRIKRVRLSSATEAAEDARDRRGIVKEFIMYILGVLSSALTTILAYYFGSSKGSADKNSALNLFAAKGQTTTEPVAGASASDGAAKEKGAPQAAAG